MKKISKKILEVYYPELYKNSVDSQEQNNRLVKSHFHNITDITFIPDLNNKQLSIKTKVKSKTTLYDCEVIFDNVQYEPKDTPENETFKGVNSEQYHVQPIHLDKSNIKVSCSCLDFLYRFSMINFQNKSLAGDRPLSYTPKTNREPQNTQPGVCKHIISTIEHLKNSRLIQ